MKLFMTLPYLPVSFPSVVKELKYFYLGATDKYYEKYGIRRLGTGKYKAMNLFEVNKEGVKWVIENYTKVVREIFAFHALNFTLLLHVFHDLLKLNRRWTVLISDVRGPNELLFKFLIKIEIDEKQIRPVTGTPLLLPGFREQVVVLNAQPSLEATIFENLLDANVRAFIILGFGAGNLPATYGHWIDFISTAVDQGNVVFVGSQSVYGGIDLNLYECGKQALRAGARGIGKMTLEAAYVKLQKILKLTSDQDGIYDKFFQNWAGEI
jgi:hypothetical protein